MAKKSKKWYHGSDDVILEWKEPPNVTSKPHLTPHPFICLSQDYELAQGAAPKTKQVYEAEINKNINDARILNLTKDTASNQKYWELMCSMSLNDLHDFALSFDKWLAYCKNGDILRMRPQTPELKLKFFEMEQHLDNKYTSSDDRQQIFVYLQNMTRNWINTIIFPAKQFGYQAVICYERNKKQLSKPHLNLHVFDQTILTSPTLVKYKLKF